MQHRGMRGKARPDRRTGVGFRPVDDGGEVVPERLLGQGRGDRLGAGDDQPVDVQAAEIGDIGVMAVDRSAVAACDRLHRRQREAMKMDAAVAGGRVSAGA